MDAAGAPWHLAACLFNLFEFQNGCPQNAHSSLDLPTSRGCLFSMCRLRLPDLGKSSGQCGQAYRFRIGADMLGRGGRELEGAAGSRLVVGGAGGGQVGDGRMEKSDMTEEGNMTSRRQAGQRREEMDG